MGHRAPRKTGTHDKSHADAFLPAMDCGTGFFENAPNWTFRPRKGKQRQNSLKWIVRYRFGFSRTAWTSDRVSSSIEFALL